MRLYRRPSRTNALGEALLKPVQASKHRSTVLRRCHPAWQPCRHRCADALAQPGADIGVEVSEMCLVVGPESLPLARRLEPETTSEHRVARLTGEQAHPLQFDVHLVLPEGALHADRRRSGVGSSGQRVGNRRPACWASSVAGEPERRTKPVRRAAFLRLGARTRLEPAACTHGRGGIRVNGLACDLHAFSRHLGAPPAAWTLDEAQAGVLPSGAPTVYIPDGVRCHGGATESCAVTSAQTCLEAAGGSPLSRG